MSKLKISDREYVELSLEVYSIEYREKRKPLYSNQKFLRFMEDFDLSSDEFYECMLEISAILAQLEKSNKTINITDKAIFRAEFEYDENHIINSIPFVAHSSYPDVISRVALLLECAS